MMDGWMDGGNDRMVEQKMDGGMDGWTIEQVDRIMNFETMELFVYFAVHYKKTKQNKQFRQLANCAKFSENTLNSARGV